MFEELDYQQTPLGAVSLRRRNDPKLNGDMLWEVKLNDEFLMSSAFTVGERVLAEHGLARLEQSSVTAVVGGLGLGYTAAAALSDTRITELVVIEFLSPVLEWHRQGWLPDTQIVVDDPRCRLLAGDFFALSQSADGFDHGAPGRRFDAVLLDIDHSPRHRLNEDDSEFYSQAGMRALAAQLNDGGVFGMWSNDPPDDDFTDVLETVFLNVEAEVVRFPNPYQGGDAQCTLYFGDAASAL